MGWERSPLRLENTHIQAVKVVRPTGFVRLALLAAVSCMRSRISNSAGDAVPAHTQGAGRTDVCDHRAWHRYPGREHHITRGKSTLQGMRDAIRVIPTYSAPASGNPRAPSISITLERCLSARLPDRISSPMMMRPELLRHFQRIPVTAGDRPVWRRKLGRRIQHLQTAGGAGGIGSSDLSRSKAAGQKWANHSKKMRKPACRSRLPGNQHKSGGKWNPEAQTMAGAAPR